MIHGQTVYLFDFAGEFIQKYVNVKFASEKLNIPECVIRSAINRHSLVQNRFYFSYSKDLIMNIGQNPLFTEIRLCNDDTEVQESIEELEIRRIVDKRYNDWIKRWNSIIECVRKYKEYDNQL